MSNGGKMKYIVYGTPQCTFCDQAKRLLEQNGLSYDYKEIMSKEGLVAMQEKVGKPVRSVPQIFKMQDGFAEYLGGFDELKQTLSGVKV